jgi:Na+-transporting methylmalonyl-CoA/oxaloacetate decarboxylase gamma subunit
LDVLVVLAILAILAVVVWVVGSPLRAGANVEEESSEAAALEELEAEKAHKYREIRDADLDRRTGKLDEADWRAVDRQLRAEAVVILRRIDELGGGGDDSPD